MVAHSGRYRSVAPIRGLRATFAPITRSGTASYVVDTSGAAIQFLADLDGSAYAADFGAGLTLHPENYQSVFGTSPGGYKVTVRSTSLTFEAPPPTGGNLTMQ